MTWSWFELRYLALSPLHIGFQKFGLVQRTRTYMPGRSLWGALANRLALAMTSRGKSQPDYQAAGEWLKENVRFTYFFPYLENDPIPLLPWFASPPAEGLCYGYRSGTSPKPAMTAGEFEQSFIHVFGQTAIFPDSNTATEASLHETEFLSHRVIPPGLGEVQRVLFQGYLGVKVGSTPSAPDLWSVWHEIDVGGDRSYGYGRLRLSQNPQPLNEQVTLFSIPGGSILNPAKVSWPKQVPLPAHVEISPSLPMAGDLEPLVGRETDPGDDSRRFGQNLSVVSKCWTPGSVLLKSGLTFTIDPLGIWKLNLQGTS